ncbi:MAG: HAD family phosphatase [Granulosicoccus sp.]|nr:HAD family phosphatase [Granulosicoccus sp.]
MNKNTILLFDLGGVLIELGGQPLRNEWLTTDDSADESWNKWLTSDVARDFETGRISAADFSRRIVTEMQLLISPEAFLEHFTRWPVGLYPGVLELLNRLQQNYTLALFSNSNELHWPRKMGEMQLQGKFQHYFASHRMGLAKPDAAAFNTVISTLQVPAETVFFMDDNQLNIDAARGAGMMAELTKGFEQVIQCLDARGFLNDV